MRTLLAIEALLLANRPDLETVRAKVAELQEGTQDHEMPLVARRLVELGARIEGLAVEQRAPAYPDGLTAREMEVLRLVAQGMTDREVGYDLGISEKTAANHVGSIRKKTGSSSRSQAVAYAAAKGLLSNEA